MENAIKYVIHACPQRMWFVKSYMVPALIRRGALESEIYIWNDDRRLGNLKSFVASCSACADFLMGGGAWHLQDDVAFGMDFVDRAISLTDNCSCEDTFFAGYTNQNCKDEVLASMPINRAGMDYKKFPFSFPCLYIPNFLLGGFEGWIEDRVHVKKKDVVLYNRNRYDDLFFAKYVMELRKTEPLKLFVCRPTMVEHIGHIIGGSVVTPDRRAYGDYMSMDFCDVEAMDEVSRILRTKNEIHELGVNLNGTT